MLRETRALGQGAFALTLGERVRRREFIRASGALGAAAVTTLTHQTARALPFGDAPEKHKDKLLPVAHRAQSVLECFLYGGLSQWETFYAVEEYGRPDSPNPDFQNTQSYSFNNPSNAALLDALNLCGVPTSGSLLTEFGLDAAGKMVKLGAMLKPLLDRADVLSRVRVVVNRHGLEPHEAAIPMALCGRTLGAPSMACLGAHVQRYFNEHSTGRKSPYSYSFATNFISSDNVRATVATGLHPGASRPLLIKIDGAARLNDLLDRSTVGTGSDRQRYDALMKVYLDRYRARTRWKGTGDPLRSPQLAELAQAMASVENADAVKGVLDPSLFTSIDGLECQDANVNLPAMSLRLAQHLLTHPLEPARYCCFVDPGLISADGGGGYDTHFETPHTQTRNIRATLNALLAGINTPGENDPAKLDLDKTMIVLNMDFGRSPFRQSELGRNHWPYGYVQVYIGGPITSDQRGVYGAIGEDGYATTYTTPAENRIACLLALGIWPFASDSFGVSDVQGTTDEVTSVESVTKRILGYTV